MSAICVRRFIATCSLFVSLAGCHRADPPKFGISETAKALTPELQQAVQKELTAQMGDFIKPKEISDPQSSAGNLQRGQLVYQQRCVQCHGVTGDGNGPSAQYMYPRPRDYRKGIFKFSSTPYGYRPLRDDLVKTVRQGIRGTSMPSFHLLPEADQQAVVDYVIMLCHRGELEQQLVDMADMESAIVEDDVRGDLIPTVLRKWSDADAAEVFPATPPPRFTAEHVERGKALFLSKGCSKCHGNDGRGLTLDNKGVDVWGHQTRAADLTSGMLHGGNRPIDIYRRIYNGINGTPMPGFANAFREDPQALWDIVAYVLSVTNRRRNGETPLPGPINPYISPAAEPKKTATVPEKTAL